MALPEGKTRSDALKVATQWRDKIWADRGYRDDTQRIRQLTSICTKMFGGDEAEGTSLATDAIWN